MTNRSDNSNWVARLTPEARVAEARLVADRLNEEVLRAIRLRALYMRCANAQDILDTFSQTLDAHAFVTVRNSLFVELILTLMRIYDASRPNTASLRSLGHLLDADDVRKTLHDIAESDALGGPAFVDADDEIREAIERQRAANAIEKADERLEALDNCLARLKNLKGDHRLAALKDLRDVALAHRATDDRRKTSTQYGYPSKVLDTTMGLVSDLCRSLTGLVCLYDQAQQEWDRCADQFWRRVL
jgi:AbiU2